MKSLLNYFKAQKEIIQSLLGQPKQTYSSDTFHQLRVELKKLNALFELIKFCKKGFKKKRTFKPFKKIFRQAGKVRELQVEEIVLKKYFQKHLLQNYHINLRQAQLREQEAFFALVSQKFIKKLQKKYDKLVPFLSKLNKKKVRSYLKNKRKQLEKMLKNGPLQTQEAHQLRKEVKIFYYNQTILYLNKPPKVPPQKDKLPTLLGKWHDAQVIVSHLEKAINTGKVSPKEMRQLQKIKAKMTANSELLFHKINLTLPTSEFYTVKN